MHPEAKKALHAIADEIEGFAPVPSTFAGVKRDPVVGARMTLRLVVELIRERADGEPNSSGKASPEMLAEMGKDT
jgi:hypothetical protein